jgi:hypothetical protein
VTIRRAEFVDTNATQAIQEAGSERLLLKAASPELQRAPLLANDTDAQTNVAF